MAGGSAGADGIPSGLVTFLFTDVEGSTALWAADEAAMSASLGVHDDILRSTAAEHHGYVFTTAGDSFAVAFSRASDAIGAASAAQAALAAAEWPGPDLRVRMGIHLGEAEERAGDYFGPVVNFTARLEAAGHGGQVLVSEAVVAATGIDAVDLGIHQLRDVPEPVRIHQIGEGGFDPLRIVAPTRTNLPVSASRLVGRDDAIQQVRQALLDAPLVTVTAPGGTGKTRLAVAVGEEELLNRRSGVWFVDLTPVSDGALVPAVVADALGLQLTGGHPTEQVVDYLAGLDALVIIDNCEHLVDDCADLLEAIVARPGKSRVLATTREFFDIDGERAIRLTQLGVDGADSPAVELFLQVASAADPGFGASLADGDLEVIGELCGHLDGSPLAIELAASRCNVMSPRELLAGIGERFELLRGGRRRRTRRALDDTLEWSFDLLRPDEQDLFRLLGVFSGTFEIGAAAAVGQLSRADALDLLDSLIAKSLVVAERAPTGMRFRLLETTAAYAERCLEEQGDPAAARARHLEHFAGLCESYARSELALLTPPEILIERANVRAAAEWARLNGDTSACVRLLFGAFDALATQADDLLRLAKRCHDEIGDSPGLERNQLRYVIVQAATLVDDFATVGMFMAENPESTLPAERFFGLWVRAWFEIVASEPGTGLATAGEAKAVASEVENEELRGFLVGVADTVQGLASAHLGHFPEALAHYRNALTGLSAIPATAARPLVLSATGLAHIEVGDPDAALDLADELDRYHSPLAEGLDLRMFALIAKGDLEAVRPMIRSRADDAVTGRLSRMANDTLLLLALLAEAEGDLDTARRLLPSVELARTVQTIATSISLAERLGVADAFAEHRRLGLADRRASGKRAIEVLRAEMTSRGWIARD